RFSLASPAPPPTSTLSLHDALPFCFNPAALDAQEQAAAQAAAAAPEQPKAAVEAPAAQEATPVAVEVAQEAPAATEAAQQAEEVDRKSTRLNSSHVKISYAVFCLKK